jgi:hypothetical protein
MVSLYDYIPDINSESKRLISYKEVYQTLFKFTNNDMLVIYKLVLNWNIISDRTYALYNLFKVGSVNSNGSYTSIIIQISTHPDPVPTQLFFTSLILLNISKIKQVQSFVSPYPTILTFMTPMCIIRRMK